jgi:hypothetical protein
MLTILRVSADYFDGVDTPAFISRRSPALYRIEA